MGAVWAARNELTHREFAIKFVSAPNAGSAEAKRRLLREASASGRLDHKNVVEVYDVGLTQSGEPFLVMQLLRGESLDSMLGRLRTLDVAQAAAIAAPIASALEAAHAAGIVHRDLKPENVFLHREADGSVVLKVVDFGVSKLLDAESAGSTATGTAVGSPAYMSPEQAHGDRGLDGRTDLWALGVVLYEMLTGTWPFQGQTPYAVVSQILTAPVPRLSDALPDVDPRMSDLVARCLERDVSRRIPSAAEVLRALEAWVPRDAMSSGRLLATFPGASSAGAEVHRAPRLAGSDPEPRVTDTWLAPAKTPPANVLAPTIVDPVTQDTALAASTRLPTDRRSRSSRTWRSTAVALAGVAVLGGGFALLRSGTQDLGADAPTAGVREPLAPAAVPAPAVTIAEPASPAASTAASSAVSSASTSASPAPLKPSRASPPPAKRPSARATPPPSKPPAPTPAAGKPQVPDDPG
jgi:serine/threonine-protein kinase